MTLTSIGRYRIESELGSGRYCRTFQAYDLFHRRAVALKLLQPELFSDGHAWRGFLSDIQGAADLIHPHIAWIWETGEQDGRYYLVERFIGGETLSALITQSGPLPTDQAIKALEEIAQAIEFGQQHGWTHGGVTPHNILISPDLGAVLSDYGLFSAIHRKPGRPQPDLTDAPYIPPEILCGAPVSPGADIYGLACCLIEALSGTNPFSGSSLNEIIEKKTSAYECPILPLETIPLQANKVIERALNPDPDKRFKYALDFMDAFEKNVRHGLTDAAGRAEHEEQLRRLRETQEQERIKAEETVRMEAVEKARIEIQERARIEAEQAIRQTEPPPDLIQTVDETIRFSNQAVSRQRSRPRYIWIILGILLAAALITGIFWLRNRNLLTVISVGSPTPPVYTATWASLQQTDPAPVIIGTSSPTHTATLMPTSQPSVTQTLVPSPTPSLTPTLTEMPPSVTPVRPEKENNSRGD